MKLLADILSRQDREFIDFAYAELLGRPADPSGANHYLRRLREGTSKLRILSEIAKSPEGRARRADIPGLRMSAFKHRLAGLPLVGPVIGSVLDVEGDSVAERRLRALEQQFYVGTNALDSAVRRLENTIPRISHAAGQATDQSDSESMVQVVNPEGRTTSAEFAGNWLEPTHVPVSPSIRHMVYLYVGHTVKYPLNTGVQRVTRRLAQALSVRSDSVRFVDWDGGKQCLVLISRDEFNQLARWGGFEGSEDAALAYCVDAGNRQPVPQHLSARGNWLLVPEVTHITFNAAPVTSGLLTDARRKYLSIAFLFYDATPLCRSELAGMAGRHAEYMSLLALADLVLPISEYAAEDFRAYHFLHDRGAKSTLPLIRPLGLPGESPLGAGRVRPGRVSGGEKLILCVGSITHHKNQLALIRVFERLGRAGRFPGWELVLIGGVDFHVEDALASELAAATQTRVIRSASDEVLDQYYRRCSFTVFPSLEEGFGLPIAESLWYGKPCVCADFGAMGEVAAGGGCLMIDMRDSEALGGAVATLIDTPSLLEGLGAAAAARRLGTWDDYVADLSHEFDDAASPFRSLGPIYCWIDHTARCEVNSGIQRVVRGLARALLDAGADLIPVVWNAVTLRLESADEKGLANLARWNGPGVDAWGEWREPTQPGCWLLIPELTSFLSVADNKALDARVSALQMRRAQLFFDAIPLKYPDLHGPQESQAHADYMARLCRNDLVLPISEFVLGDLTRFLETKGLRVPGMFERVLTCPLPGEFMESGRCARSKVAEEGTVRILCVATIEPRKNHLALLAAFDIMRATVAGRVELVLAGAGIAYPGLAAHIDEFTARVPEVRWIKSPDDATLGRLYEQSDFTVCASYEEGFGLPILESLWHARPCICASFGAMAEIAQGGGCLQVDVRDVDALAGAMSRMVTDVQLRTRLAEESARRPIRTWQEYALEVVQRMAVIGTPPRAATMAAMPDRAGFQARFSNLQPRPRLSICISTFNRADWLAVCLRALVRAWPTPHEQVELLVCDNASADDTAKVVQPYLDRADLRYLCNAENVGMLGNLRVTAQAARGEYIWIIGDDDVIIEGAIERVLGAIEQGDDPALIYLNYAYTRDADAGAIGDLEVFCATATPVVDPGPDQSGPVRDICANSGNFFTAIYCLVFRRDHALLAYSQCTEGAPFSSMLTAIPTTRHVLARMMDESGYWIGFPALVANMNVSWSQHAPVFVLERLPEARDLAERLGGDPARIDHWRRDAWPLMFRFFSLILEPDYEADWKHLSLRRIVSRMRGFEGVEPFIASMKAAYRVAHDRGHPAASVPVDELFIGFGEAASERQSGHLQ